MKKIVKTESPKERKSHFYLAVTDTYDVGQLGISQETLVEIFKPL